MDQIFNSIQKCYSQGGAEAIEALVQSLAQLPSDPGLSDVDKVWCFVVNGNNVEIFRVLQERLQVQATILDNTLVYNYSSNLLHWASRCGWGELVEELVLRTKMDINKPGGCGNTPLMLAAVWGRVGVVTFFLAQPNIDIDVKDVNGRTALQLAAADRDLETMKMDRDLETMKMLLKNGASDEGVLDIVADKIKSGFMQIQFQRIFQFLVKEVGLAVTRQVADKVAADEESLAVCHEAWSKPPSLLTLSRLATWRAKVVRVAEMTKDEYPEVIIDFLNLRNAEAKKYFVDTDEGDSIDEDASEEEDNDEEENEEEEYYMYDSEEYDVDVYEDKDESEDKEDEDEDKNEVVETENE